jgi:hypothetical protein
MSSWLARALDQIEDQIAVRTKGTPNSVDDLRAAIMQDGQVAPAEAQRLMDLHRNAAPITLEAGWDDLFVEALSEYFALSREVPLVENGERTLDWKDVLTKVAASFGSGEPMAQVDGTPWSQSVETLGIPEDVAQQLIDSLGTNGLALAPVEVRLLTRLFSRAVTYPDTLRTFVLQALAATIATDQAISKDEADLVKAIAMGPGSQAGIAVTQEEAEAIVAINRACPAQNKHESWANVFASALASYLLFSGTTPDRIDARERAWLQAQLADQSGTEIDTLHRFLETV